MITCATLEEIPIIITLVKQFESFSQLVKVDVEHTISTYTKFVQSGMGKIFLLKVDREIIGGLGAILAPDLHTGHLTAIECFWFVIPEHRGGGLSLLTAFEQWAREQGCTKTAMIHLEDSHSVALSKIYARRGYQLAERHYIQDLL
jgi:GNAT superfamily N-acetyltransferase